MKSGKKKQTAWLISAAALLACTLTAVLLILHGAAGNGTGAGKPAASAPDTAHRRLLNGDSEMRGIWIASVSNINYPSAKSLSHDALANELDGIISLCEENGINTVLFQVRPCSDALYNSDIFPVSEYLSGKQGDPADGGFDPLDYICGAAHEKNILVFAWINPLRIAANKNAALSENNPASLHPEWCVEYGNKLWYDPGIPGVRDLVAAGVSEVVKGYSVDGVVFDDYFYPYPEDGAVFDDSASYAEYGGDTPLADWRRENINSIIRSCYEAVRSAGTGAWFGVSPFGIWSNGNGINGGSDTRGLDAYEEIYCDALAWIKGGYVDFISPQIYWDFGSGAAPYATLVDWWKNAVRGTNVQLYISHAAYKAADWDPSEIPEQIKYARSAECDGSIFYGYKAIAGNENGVLDAIAAMNRKNNSGQ